MSSNIEAIWGGVFAFTLLSCSVISLTIFFLTYDVKEVLSITLALKAVAHLSCAWPNRVDDIMWVRQGTLGEVWVVWVDVYDDNIRKGIRVPALDKVVGESILLRDNWLNWARQPGTVVQFASDDYDRDH